MTSRIAGIALLVNCAVLALKFFAYGITHSTAVLSDALETIVNVIAALIAFWALRSAAAPLSEKHPYGQGKVEYFSAAFEGGLITFAGLAILQESFRRWRAGITPEQLDFGLVIVAIAALINFFLLLYLRRAAKQHPSAALRASQEHLYTDVLTSIGLISGLLVFHFTAWSWVDPVLAVLMALQLLYSGYSIVRHSLAALADQTDPSVLRALCDSLNRNRLPWVINVHDLRAIRSGNFHHVDCHVIVPEFWTAAQIHEEIHRFEEKVIGDYPHEGEIACHIDPCLQKYCAHCPYAPCPVRREPFARREPLRYPEITRKQNQWQH